MKYIFTCIWIIISLPLLFSQNSFLKYYDFKTEFANIHGTCRIGDEIVGIGIAWDTFSLPNRHNIFLFKSDLGGNLIGYKYFDHDTSMYIISTTGVLYFPCIIPISDNKVLTIFTNFFARSTEILVFDTDLKFINKVAIETEASNTSVFSIKIFFNNNIFLVANEYDGTKNKSFIYQYNMALKLVWKKPIPNIDKVRSFGYSNNNEFICSEYEGKDRIVITDTTLNQIKLVDKSVSTKEVIFNNIHSIVNNGFLLSNSDIFGNDIIGYTFSKNISHYDQGFNKIWTFSMGGQPDQRSAVANIIPSSDGAYFAYGQIGVRTADVNDADPGRDSFDIRIFSTVKFRDNGKIIWQRFDTLETGYFNESYAHCGGMVAADDGGLYVSGDVTCYDTVRVDGILKRRTDYKHFLMKIDSNGCVDGLHCNVEPKTETVLSVQPPLSTDVWKLSVYPNPSTGIVTVDPGTAVTKGILTVYNTLGEVVATRSLAGDESSVQLDLSGQPSGQYYITIRREDGKMAKASFIIHR